MTGVLSPDDPLYEPPVEQRRRPQRIARSDEPFAKIELSEITNGRADEAFPPLSRLYLYIKIRSGNGCRSVYLTNDGVLDIRLSRWQKYKLLRRLETAGLVAVDRLFGEAPRVSIIRTGDERNPHGGERFEL
jgi:hypothetical protein